SKQSIPTHRTSHVTDLTITITITNQNKQGIFFYNNWTKLVALVSSPQRTHSSLGAPKMILEAHPISGRPESIPGGLGSAPRPSNT
ncbi:hypothetical protein M5D96_010623, partial [Drosophila gunungcola]